MSAGGMNEFVEVVLGSLIVIPIEAGYLWLDWVRENAGFGMAFQTMPFLFENWGPFLATMAGVFWFALLFFAGITSSLAMGTPWMGFLRDEFGMSREKSAWTFGLVVLILGLPTVFFYHLGVFGEYDYWAGTVSLVVFALAESIIFAWIYGIDKGWEEIKSGSDIKVPGFYKPIIKYVTPTFLLFVFLGSLISPLGGDWGNAFQSLLAGEGWALDNGSLIRQLLNSGLRDEIAAATDDATRTALETRLFFINAARLLLFAAFVGISSLIYIAHRKRIREGRA
jgi:hypothetical protein